MDTEKKNGETVSVFLPEERLISVLKFSIYKPESLESDATGLA
jgi:hypothetical protein